MSRTIFLHNKSDHDQTFEVHGVNDNQNITVGPQGTAKIEAPDHSSGAIIALHDGFEGEQAEFTKDGNGGNDVVDLSNIIGAGGDMTVAQIDNLNAAKGDPIFMQDLNRAWQQTSQETRDSLSDCVHLDQSGKVIRIDPLKSFKKLEDFCRTFANGQTYLGTGGNPDDDKQSAAGVGNKDIMVTYSDENAAPVNQGGEPVVPQPQPPVSIVDPNRPAVYNITPGDTFFGLGQRYGLTVAEIECVNPNVDPNKLQPGQSIVLKPTQVPSTYIIGDSDNFCDLAAFFGIPQGQIEAANPGVDPRTLKVGQKVNLILTSASTPQPQPNGSGIILSNKSGSPCTYYFFNNLVNNGINSVPDFKNPWTKVSIQGQQSTFVPLPNTFKGRVQRGFDIPATWAEFQLDASDDHGAHGDISVEQGDDGGAQISSTDGSSSTQGFTATSGDIQTWGPPDAFQVRADGIRAIASTLGNWIAGQNQDAINAQKDRIGKSVYVTGGTGIPDVASKNQCLAVAFF